MSWYFAHSGEMIVVEFAGNGAACWEAPISTLGEVMLEKEPLEWLDACPQRIGQMPARNADSR